MSTPTSVATPSAETTTRVGMLRTGLLLSAVFAGLGLIPLLDTNFDGSGWDIALIAFAIIAVVVALGCIGAAVLGWNGRRAPAITAVILLIVSMVPALPAFFLPLAETTAEAPGPLLAVISLVITLVIITLILVGSRRANARATRRAH